MKFLIFKYLVTSALVVGISESARSGQAWAALVAALPTIATLSLIWMHLEGSSESQLSRFSLETFWYVLPSLPLFLIFALAAPKAGFWPALLAGSLTSATLFWFMRRWLAAKGSGLI